MTYEVIIKPSAQKDLDKLPDKELKRIVARLEQLRINPRPIGVQKLSDEDGYRLRSGDGPVRQSQSIHKTVDLKNREKNSKLKKIKIDYSK